jgi:proline dehydrogenase
MIMNFSHLISQLRKDIQNPLLENILWIIEDFSGMSMEEDQELLKCNIVARVTEIMETLIKCLANCYLDQQHSSLQLDQKTAHGMTILNKCLVIISNLAAHVPDARTEILKNKVMDIMGRAFQVYLVQGSKETLVNIARLLRNLT